MKDYLIVRGQIDPIEHEKAPATYKPEEWMKLERVARATIRMHLSESVYYTVQSCTIVKELWKKLLDTYEKKVTATKIYLIRRLYNLPMKEFDSITAHLNEYEGIISQLSALLGNFRHDRMQRIYCGREVLRDYELHSV
jgi:hypothetical protein